MMVVVMVKGEGEAKSRQGGCHVKRAGGGGYPLVL